MKAALMGHGVVGSGVAEILLGKRDFLAKKAGQPIELVKILDLRDFPDLDYRHLFTKEFTDICEDDSVGIVIEAMGGLHPAYDFVKTCLEKGKSVVTSNKELVAEKGAELLNIAREKNVNFFFEASVGGGIPVIRPMHLCLAANKLDKVYGILNGTTNFILTKMIKEQMSFEAALAIAQELGYAEKDPTADVEGIDACRKICILASIACGKHIYPQEVHAEGITAITSEDVAYAASAGYVVKLIGQAVLGEEKHQVMVSPMLISVDHQLSSVDDVFNAVLVQGDCTGDVLFYGKGAGKFPTASAVVADVVHAAKMPGTSLSLRWEDSGKDTALPFEECENSFYYRLQGDVSADRVEELWGEVIWLTRKDQPDHEVAFTTARMKEGKALLAESRLENAQILGKIRILEQ